MKPEILWEKKFWAFLKRIGLKVERVDSFPPDTAKVFRVNFKLLFTLRIWKSYKIGVDV